MFITAFFLLAITHNILLMWRFYGIIKTKFVEVKPIWYELILIPTFLLLFIGILIRIDPGELLVLGLLIAFAVLMIFYTYIWRVENLLDYQFRIPYILLYYPVNIGLVYFVWQNNIILGVITLILTLVQISMNSLHNRRSLLLFKRT